MTKPKSNTSTKPHKPSNAAVPRVAVASGPGAKSATVLALLASKDGTTITEIANATGWQNHSIRGFLSGTVKKKLGRVIAREVVDGERRYRIGG